MAEMNVAEVEYRDVVGVPGYRVGSDGSVWSFKTGRPKPLAGGRGRGGYRLLVLCADGRRRTRRVHHLVLEAFVGPRPPGMQACHFNDQPDDNRLDNLRWDTRSANEADKERNGHVPKGEANGSSSLTEAEVLKMREMSHAGVSNPDIAKHFGCNYRTVSVVVTGESWKHVGGPIRPKKKGGTAPRIFVDGLTLNEIAAQEGVTMQAIYYRLKRGQPLRKELRPATLLNGEPIPPFVRETPAEGM